MRDLAQDRPKRIIYDFGVNRFIPDECFCKLGIRGGSGELQQDGIKELTCCFPGECDRHDALGCYVLSGEQLLGHEGDVSIRELPRFT